LCVLLLIRVSQVRDLHGLPKLEGLPCWQVLGRIRVSKHWVNRHPDFIVIKENDATAQNFKYEGYDIITLKKLESALIEADFLLASASCQPDFTKEVNMSSRTPTLKSLIEAFRLSCHVEGKSPKTIEWYLDFLNRFQRFTALRDWFCEPSHIDRGHIREFILYLRMEAINPHNNGSKPYEI
jgi:hypothetical protein